MGNELDSLFEQYAVDAEKEAKAKSNRSYGYTQREYEDIKYCGLQTGIPSVIRAIGGPPRSNVDNFTAKRVTVSRIVGDNGKRFRLVRPYKDDDPNHLITRIINKVKQPAWVNNEKIYPVKNDFPEIFNIVENNGVKKGEPRAIFEKGWYGKDLLVMNVIDRSNMDWHRQNKHTMLLANKVGEYEGNEYVDPLDSGISFSAADSKISQLFRFYGSWEKYDIAITKTGEKTNAFNITNATRNPETVIGDAAQFISMEDHLTDEEKSWEKYDLSKIYKATSYTKIYNRLKTTIARIDTSLNTHFLQELEAEVEKEKELFDELYGDNRDPNDEDTSVSIPNASTIQKDIPLKEDSKSTPNKVETSVSDTASSAPKARTRTSDSGTTSGWQSLPFGDTLSDELKAKVKSVRKNPDGKYDVEWNCPVEDLASCPECGGISPLEATKCPCCGIDF